jgi:hypothetical protein
MYPTIREVNVRNEASSSDEEVTAEEFQEALFRKADNRLPIILDKDRPNVTTGHTELKHCSISFLTLGRCQKVASQPEVKS